MTRFGAAALLAALTSVPALLAADPKPRDVILGKWESIDGISKGVVVEFKDDGTTVASYQGKVMTTGKFKFVEDDVMEFESGLAGKPLVTRFKMKLDGDVLIQTDVKTGIEKKLKRVK